MKNCIPIYISCIDVRPGSQKPESDHFIVTTVLSIMNQSMQCRVSNDISGIYISAELQQLPDQPLGSKPCTCKVQDSTAVAFFLSMNAGAPVQQSFCHISLQALIHGKIRDPYCTG